MVSAQKLAAEPRVRAMLVGYPGAGKTGALAALANAGFKLRILDFDGNYEPLLMFTDADKLSNIDIVTLEDKMIAGPEGMDLAGIPEAFTKMHKMMDRWKYKEGEEEVDLGKSSEWGPDTVVVVDSLTGMGRASMHRILAIRNRTIRNSRRQDHGAAMAEQEAFCERITSAKNRFHVIVLSHLKLVSPKGDEKDDSDLTKELKERTADVVPTRLFPSALGQALPPVIGEHFPTLLLVERRIKPGGKIEHIITDKTGAELDTKIPILDPGKEWKVEAGGLLDVFKALGVKPPEPDSAPAGA